MVVFPVPPFWERTAIVTAIESDYMRRRRDLRTTLPARRRGIT